MQTISTAFERELTRILSEETERMIAELSTGSALDYASYREKCGEIRGIARVVEYFAEVNKILDERR